MLSANLTIRNTGLDVVRQAWASHRVWLVTAMILLIVFAIDVSQALKSAEQPFQGVCRVPRSVGLASHDLRTSQTHGLHKILYKDLFLTPHVVPRLSHLARLCFVSWLEPPYAVEDSRTLPICCARRS